VARRDAILDFAAELLDLTSFSDYGPQGMQVAGTEEVTKLVCGVSSSLELFERAAAAGAQLVLVHHGLLWENEPRTIDLRMRRRLQALFDPELTLAAYHLALDAHPEVGNNALLARELGVEVEEPFAGIGQGGRLVSASAWRPSRWSSPRAPTRWPELRFSPEAAAGTSPTRLARATTCF
jgi:putative NIF3 family GTP cyclohydrolase 1 type 2